MRIFVGCNGQASWAPLEAELGKIQGLNVSRFERDRIADHLTTDPPEVVLLSVGRDPARELQLLQQLVPLLPSSLLAVVGPATDPKFILQVLKQGAARYVDEAELQAELTQLIAEAGRAQRSAVRPLGKVVVVVGVTGGCGASTISLNCAIESARLQRTCGLIDLDLRKGDLASMLNLTPDHTLADFCRNLSRMDDVMFRQCFVSHGSGVQLMAAPTRYREIGSVTSEAVQQLLTMARSRFDTVWVDLRQYFQPESIPVLKTADHVICVMRQDFTSLQHAARFLGYLDDQQISPNPVAFVIGRYGQSRSASLKELESALKTRVLQAIPDDPYSANESTNKGQPVLQLRPRSALAKALRSLATNLTVSQKRGFLLKW